MDGRPASMRSSTLLDWIRSRVPLRPNGPIKGPSTLPPRRPPMASNPRLAFVFANANNQLRLRASGRAGSSRGPTQNQTSRVVRAGSSQSTKCSGLSGKLAG